MGRILRTGCCVLAILILLLAAPLRGESVAGPQGSEEGPYRRQLWLIPSPDRGVLIRALVFRPSGPGPFPLVVINHGTAQTELRRGVLPLPEFAAASEWFVTRGFAVVVPQRLGHGETGGEFLEDQGGCDDADFHKAGFGAAQSIEAALVYMTAQPFVRKAGVILVGHSAGAWGAFALASRNLPQVKAVIGFAAGRGGWASNRPGNNCAPDRLVATAGLFGKTTRIPTLWIYAENDSFFGPALAKQMAASFRAAGGRVEFHLLPPFGTDGHYLFPLSDSVPIWAPIVERFLAGLK
jgi:dienelactone hydrolase